MARNKTLITEITCDLDDDYFGDWDSLSPEIQQWWEQQDTVPCEGEIGTYCSGCPFCSTFNVWEE